MLPLSEVQNSRLQMNHKYLSKCNLLRLVGEDSSNKIMNMSRRILQENFYPHIYHSDILVLKAGLRTKDLRNLP